MIPDTWHVTPHTSHLTPHTWHVTHDMWHMVGGEHSLKISAPQLLRFGKDSVLKILSERITHLMNYKSVYKTALATPGLLMIEQDQVLTSDK